MAGRRRPDGRAGTRRARADRGGAVVVTGCSSGIGRATALTLARRGWRVFATVRRPEDGAALLAAGSGSPLETVPLDVTDEGQIAAVAARVREALVARGERLAGLVNNAGIVAAGPLEELAPARLRRVLEVNVVGALAVTQAFLPLLRAGRGRVVNVSSVSGRLAPPFLGAYAASKFALEALSDTLRVELRPWGIGVVLIEPGPVATPIWRKGEAEWEREHGMGADAAARSPYAPYVAVTRANFLRAGERGMAPEMVAGAIERALTARWPRARYVVSRHALLFAAGARLAPAALIDAAILHLRWPVKRRRS